MKLTAAESVKVRQGIQALAKVNLPLNLSVRLVAIGRAILAGSEPLKAEERKIKESIGTKICSPEKVLQIEKRFADLQNRTIEVPGEKIKISEFEKLNPPPMQFGAPAPTSRIPPILLDALWPILEDDSK